MTMTATREAGRATSFDGLKQWPTSKLKDQILKQIRFDLGGSKDPAETVRQKAAAVGVILDRDQCEFTLSMMRATASGSRDRIELKLDILHDRCDAAEDARDRYKSKLDQVKSIVN